ncbi:MAG: hypothetical protein DRI01_10670 [Chloroflexi bacterium]|nr:MAG: hypothetical protein DRI01_10670 [Chloroflexota bacterium]
MLCTIKITHGPGPSGFELIFDDPRYAVYDRRRMEQVHSVVYERWEAMPKLLQNIFNRVYRFQGYEALKRGFQVTLRSNEIERMEPDLEVRRIR